MKPRKSVMKIPASALDQFKRHPDGIIALLDGIEFYAEMRDASANGFLVFYRGSAAVFQVAVEELEKLACFYENLTGR